MFSPRKQTETEDWFQRLNAPLNGLPAAERAEMRTEIRQHLDALTAAHEELGSPPDEAWRLALAQFGDPTRIGRRLRREAMALSGDPNRWAANPLMAAFIYSSVLACGLQMGVLVVMIALMGILALVAPGLIDSWESGLGAVLGGTILLGPIWAGWMTGAKMKQAAAAGTFCSFSAPAAFAAFLLLGGYHFDIPYALMLLGGSGGGCLAAWVALRQRVARLGQATG
jgi:uncharacterized membrane protein